MNTEKLNTIEQKYLRRDLPNFKVGDTIEVETIIRESGKQRMQKFTGLVIAIKGSGTRKMFTVRKISYGVGVEKTFPYNSTNVAGIKVIKHGGVRRSKIYYMRDRIGKLAMKVKPGGPAPVIEYPELAQEVIEEVSTDEVATEESQVEDTTAEAIVEETGAEESTEEVKEEATEAEEEKE